MAYWLLAFLIWSTSYNVVCRKDFGTMVEIHSISIPFANTQSEIYFYRQMRPQMKTITKGILCVTEEKLFF